MADHPVRDEIQLLSGDFYVDRPLEHFKWMRGNAPVYRDEAGGVWGVALHEDIMHCSKSPKIFCSGKSSRPEEGSWIPSMINLDDPDHKRRRNLVNRGFTPRRVADHEPLVRRVVTELINAVAEKGSCDFVREVAAPLPMAVIGTLLGVEEKDWATLLQWSEDMLLGTNANASDEIRMGAMKAGSSYAQYAIQVIAERRKAPRDDLMGILVDSEIDGERLTDEEMVQESLLILVGGDETTRHVITGGMQALIEHPDQRQKLIDDPSKIPTAVEEMLRWVTPIKNMNRTATRDVELRGQKIQEGDKVLLLYPSGNRDERVFDDPDVFDVERTPNDHVAFGGYGTHFCLGAPLARLELRVIFEELLRRLPNMEIDGELPLRPSNFIVGIERMPVVFTPAPG
jgi:cytochrome P450 family 142 subfamily A polypeptide 1